jgi:hypothetical protein
MKTAVEWLIDEIDMQYPNINVKNKEWMIDKAKVMEEEQIINATLHGFRQDSDGDDWEGDNYNAEKYYNETFKQQEQ